MTEPTRILVIDDSEDDRTLYRRALSRAETVQYDILECDNGDLGLAMIDEHPPECVLLDYSLPGRNGIEVLKRLRSKHAFVPVVMLTGQGSEKIAVAAMQAGAQNYVTKSTVTPEELHRSVQLAIAHCAMERRIHDQRLSLEIFTRALAHDLKEPVRTIKSFLSVLMMRESLSNEGKRYFDYVHDAADRMASLIDAVYYYTRLDSSAPQMPKEHCDLEAVLRDAKLDLSELIRERRALVTSDALPSVHANSSQVRQVLQNLIANAIRHCTIDPVIHVDAVEEADSWRIRVADNGAGIDDELRERIFEPFTRFAHHKSQGLGMGLAICKRIVESHDGKIWSEKGDNGGAVFVFSIPKEKHDAPAIEPTPPRALKHADPLNDKPLAKILVVDDNDAAIELTRIVLIEGAKLRCVLMGANGGDEALALLRAAAEQSKTIDLVLLDINMPRMDGFELLAKMRSEETMRDIPVVMCSTSGYDKDMDRATQMGAVGYMTKPAELNKLRPVLEKLPSLLLSQQADGCLSLRVA